MTSISITNFGAVGDGVTDNTAAIQKAFDYAAANGDSVIIPAGTFAHSGTLTMNGITVTGVGTDSILKATNSAAEAITLTGTGDSLTNLQIDGTGTTRLTTWQSDSVWVNGASHYVIQNVLINGGAGGGIANVGSSYGQVLNNTVENTLADSIHTTDGSNNITIEQNRIINSGDDGISVVSYVGQPISHDVTIQNNTVLDNNWGRGISVVGGNNVSITSNHVEGGSAQMAGVYIAAESEWNTQGVSNVTVQGNTLINAGGNQGAITVYNSQGGGTTITGLQITGNQIENPLYAGIQFVGSGTETGSITNNTVYASGSNHPLFSSGDSAANFTNSGNQELAPSSYPGDLVPAGGGVGTATSAPTPPPTSTSGSGSTSGSTSGSSSGSSSTSSSGQDTITIHASADAGATFKLIVDGHQVGGEYSVTARHDQGASQNITITGNLGLTSGNHTVTIDFDDHTASSHNALYIGSINVDGLTYQGTGATNQASPGHTDPSDAPMLNDGNLIFHILGVNSQHS